MRADPRKSLIGILEKYLDDVPRRGAEIGVWRGETSKALLDYFPELSLYGIDNYPKGHYIKTFDGTGPAEAYEEMLDTLADYGRRSWYCDLPSNIASQGYPDNSFDFVYIDADHYYDSVKEDINLWYPKVVPGGILSGHDYDGRGDNMKRKPFGVKKAVDEFCQEKGYELILGDAHVWALKKR